jgi:hypothetical protein
MPTVFGIFLLLEIFKYYRLLKIDYFIDLNEKGFRFLVMLLISFMTIFLCLISAYIKAVTIDQEKKTITFKNIIFRNKKTYMFSDFDGIIDTFLMHGSGSYKIIGFVKNKKVTRFINNFYYSNFNELRKSLDGFNFIGQHDFGQWKRLKILFHSKVLD